MLTCVFLMSVRHIPHNKCRHSRACTSMQQYSSRVAMEIIANYLETCASIVQAIVCCMPTYCPDALSPDDYLL